MNIARSFPCNVEMEMRLIGSLCMDPNAWSDLPPGFGSHCFWRDSHAVIYAALERLIASGARLEGLSVEDELRRCGDLERAGGRDAVLDAVVASAHGLDAKYFAEVIHQHYVRREAMRISGTLHEASSAAESEANEPIEAALNELVRLVNRGSSESVRTVGESVTEAMALIDLHRNGDVFGLSTGFADLDAMLGGLVPGRMIILAGRPSMGKTAFALVMANRLTALMAKVLFVSQEMGHVELTMRALSSESNIDSRRIQDGVKLTDADLGDIREAAMRLSARTLTIDDTPGRTIAQIEALARRLQSKQGLDVIFVDYAQLLETEPNSKANRQEAVAKISRGLKRIARSLSVPVVVLSQLNRAVEAREDKTPRMADLRESGALEQDADQIVLIHLSLIHI